MELSFLGAADTVTGSRTVLKYKKTNVLIDCGLFQGSKEMRQRNRDPFPIAISSLKAVCITHAHIDHSGYLPRLIKEGYKGPIHCSKGSYDLLKIMLYDTAHLEEEFAAYANKKGYSNHKPSIPLFTQEDVDVVMKLLVPHERHKWFQIESGMQFRFLNAGHIIGASMIQWKLDEKDGPVLLTFTGDLGNNRLQTMKAPEILEESDVLVLESTYGNRLQERQDLMKPFSEIANHCFKQGGCLVIPSFAVGRAQEVLYLIRMMEDRGLIPKVPVVLDSPMSQEATSIFFKHPEDHRFPLKGKQASDFLPHNFETASSVDESMMTGMRDGPLIIISAAGMLNGGRILQHLKRKLPIPENTVLFVGYQAEGTKGRYLQDHHGEGETIRIHHQEIPIHANIATLHGLSSHADYEDTLQWLSKMKIKPKHIFLNHGSEESKQFLAEKIQESFKVMPTVVQANLTKRLFE